MHIEHLPTTPGAIIGYRKNGTPIRLIAGGSEGDGGGDGGEGSTGDGGAQGGENTGGDGGQNPPGDGGENNGQGGEGEGDVSALPGWAQKLIRDTRGEAANHRTKAKESETKHQGTLDAIAKALGLKDDDKPTDPVKLAEELASERAGGQEARVELAVFKAASKHGANAEKLLDSRAFADKLKGVDPGDSKKVGELIKKAVEDNPAYRAVTAPPASGAPMGGSPPGNKPKTIEAAVAARYKK
jgi:hypothetical protein